MTGPGTPAGGDVPERRVPSAHGHYEPEVEGMSRQTDLANAVIGYLLAGPLTFGGLGWLLDLWLDTGFLLPVGVVLGMVLSMYTIWFRYGRP